MSKKLLKVVFVCLVVALFFIVAKAYNDEPEQESWVDFPATDMDFDSLARRQN